MMKSPTDLKELEKTFFGEIQKADTPEELEALRVRYLGRKSPLNFLLENLKNLPLSKRQKIGEEINALKENFQAVISKKKAEQETRLFEASLEKKRTDWTLPSFPFAIGKSHPLNQVLEEVTEIFMRLGFTIEEGPQIESDENNFNALNIPENHPARDMHDTFYIKSAVSSQKSEVQNPRTENSQLSTLNSQLLLRTHTSPVQIRVMRRQPPPIRMIAPGKVYRHEAIDATHSSVFHQVEGLVVDQAISFADLKGTLEIFNRQFFGKNVKTRFRPSYFPFVEPGAEVDISCTLCRSGNLSNPSGTEPSGRTCCSVCKGSGWIEMLGAGMVHPNVFKAVGYDPEAVTGFAFGMGIERMAMVRYGINDMRLFYENHLDFLKQF